MSVLEAYKEQFLEDHPIQEEKKDEPKGEPILVYCGRELNQPTQTEGDIVKICASDHGQCDECKKV